ncbi:hypothetical protein FHY31_003867 [Xanthomonas euvesicatoria]|uniref:Uncharacterized protein n=1 Tax=Xanthomonas euvesicatoria TaxID=456327 RepID=A0AAW3U8I6_XANEU|nr:hypothetical protein [Xanthomonas euvesicatoria]MBB4872058.1 hypothetical protein [Xanthomonas euvesicatoria]
MSVVWRRPSRTGRGAPKGWLSVHTVPDIAQYWGWGISRQENLDRTKRLLVTLCSGS